MDKNGDEQTALNMAILSENKETVECLVTDNAVSIYEKNSHGYDALVFAMTVCAKNSDISPIIVNSPEYNSNKKYSF